MRVGVLVPYANTNLELDLNRFNIEKLNYYITRIGGYEIDKIPDDEQMKQMGETNLTEALKLINGIILNVKYVSRNGIDVRNYFFLLKAAK